MMNLAALLLLPLAATFQAAEPRLHIDVRGEGSPTVVMEAGFASTPATGSKGQPEGAKFARVVAYDRAGLGSSEAGPSPRTAERIANELHSALRSAGLRPPYVLVSHSAGGAYIRVFAHLYPKEVAGLVFVDPPYEEFLDWLRTNAPSK